MFGSEMCRFLQGMHSMWAELCSNTETIFICTFTMLLPNQKAIDGTPSVKVKSKGSTSVTSSKPQFVSTVHHFVLNPLAHSHRKLTEIASSPVM